MTNLPHWSTYFSPSMKGADDEGVMEFAQHIERSVKLGVNGTEALRMAKAQLPQHRVQTMKRALELALHEVFERDAA